MLRLAILSVVLLGTAFPAFAVRFDAKDMAHRNQVYVISDGPLEKVVAFDPLISGWVELNPEQISEGIQGEFEIDLRALTSGIEVRDLIMRNQLIEVTRYPIATLKLNRWGEAVKGKIPEGKGATYKVEATLKLRDKAVTFT